MGHRNGFWAVLVVVVMAVGGLSVAVLGGHSSPSALASSHGPAASAAQAAPTVASVAETGGPVQFSAANVASSVTPGANGPHPGTLKVYEPVPGGATTEDPALAYDTTSYEPILNVYQTFVAYNGSSTASFVPTLATCVPGQGSQCASDYGGGFTGIYNQTGAIYTGHNGQPQYWSFVIDPAARYYDAGTGQSWAVYPSDAMFSIARTLAWADYPYVGKTAGWILAQSLLPIGSSSWDNGTHFPYNNTPKNILGSMLINDSSYCPTKAMDGTHGHGCITFVADGSAQEWPEFLQFVADNLGGSIVPCGWFTSQGAGIPGWSAHGGADASCKLPNGQTTTNNAAWTTYLAGLGDYSWDSFELSNINWPSTQPHVQWSMVGSGPYYAAINPGLTYSLAPNPDYAQPSGCGGDPTDFPGQYTGYCDPAPGAYIPNVDVVWETSEQGDSLGTSAILSGTADFAGIYTTHTSTLLGFVHSGIWQYNLFPTLSDAFTLINLGTSYGAYNTTFPGSPLESNPLAPLAFSDIGLRNFYINAYPYTTIENTINTVDGIQFSFNAGGPIPVAMGNYYPANVSWPYLRGDPTQPASTVGSAAWWWQQITTPSSPYYDAKIATKCTTSSPCTWPIGYFDGAPANLNIIDDWVGEIESLSSNALKPWPLAETFTQFLTSLDGPYEGPLMSSVGFGWAPDYPDPTDYVTPIAQPGGSYPGPDTFDAQLFLPTYEQNATCGHYGVTAFANLTYWANQAQDPAGAAMTDACQGVAYRVASYWMGVAGALPAGTQRVLDYNLIEQITNALGMYVYNGQSNELVGFAPWIDPSSINENPVIGGGGDSLWYQVRYNPVVYTVNVTESGLPGGTQWSATLAGTTLSSTTATISFPYRINGTFNYSVSFQQGYNVTPSNGTVVIAGANVTVDVTYQATSGPTTDLYFNETGLISNTSWQVVLVGYGALSSNYPSLDFVLPQSATYQYQPRHVLGYLPPAGGNVSLGTGPTTVAVAFSGVAATIFAVTFNETGLPPGANWSVTVGPPSTAYTLSTNGTSLTFYLTNASYPVTFTAPAGYEAPTSAAVVVVNGADVQVTVPFSATGSAFAVTFTETGLPLHHLWNVTVDNLTLSGRTASQAFEFPNGTYNWTVAPIAGYTLSAASGNVTVNGTAETVSVTFTVVLYQVTFFEGGLPSGTSWSVEVTNSTGAETTYSGTAFELYANLSNDTYTYAVQPVPGFTATPASGTVMVNGTIATVVIIFSVTPTSYTVTFTAVGLASGAHWTVDFAGQTQTGTGPGSLTFTATNGSWTYFTSAVGYNATPAGGTVTVAGADQSITVTFAVPPSPSTAAKPSWSYLGTLAYILIGVLALLAVIGFALAARSAGRRPPATPPESWTEGSTPPSSGDSGESGEAASTGAPPEEPKSS